MFLIWRNSFPNNKKIYGIKHFSGTVISTFCFLQVIISIWLSFFLHNLITFFVLHFTMLNQQIRLLLENVPSSYRFTKDCVVISINEKAEKSFTGHLVDDKKYFSSLTAIQMYKWILSKYCFLKQHINKTKTECLPVTPLKRRKLYITYFLTTTEINGKCVCTCLHLSSSCKLSCFLWILLKIQVALSFRRKHWQLNDCRKRVNEIKEREREREELAIAESF